MSKSVGKGFRTCQGAAICSCCGNAAGIHEGHCRHLPLTGLAPFPVREVARIVTDGKPIVVWRVACAKARPAESRLDYGTGRHEVREESFLARSI